MRWLHWPLHALALLSLPLAIVDWRRGRNEAFLTLVVPLGLLVLYHVAVLSILLPAPRYSIPLRPYAYVLAMLVAARVFARERRTGVRPHPVAMAGRR